MDPPSQTSAGGSSTRELLLLGPGPLRPHSGLFAQKFLVLIGKKGAAAGSAACLHDYIEAAGIADDIDGYLFRTARRKTGQLTTNPLFQQENAGYRHIRRTSSRTDLRFAFTKSLFCCVFGLIEERGALPKQLSTREKAGCQE
jgi:hypothetical protein